MYYRINDSGKCQLLHYAIEKMMNLICPGQFDLDSQFFHEHINPLNKEQRCYIEKIHDDILENLDKRISINDLAVKYSISPSALKYQFKKVYGKSIAAHIKEHRMESRRTVERFDYLPNRSQSALQVQVNSAVFSSIRLLPNEYRKIHQM